MEADLTELLKPSSVEEESFTTSVNNHGIPAYLAGSFGDPVVSDIIICIQNQRFYLHKLILMQSEVFAAMFNHAWVESVKQEITLDETELCALHMEEFFKYFYGVTVDINYKNVIALAVLADKYHMTSLMTACQESFQNCLLRLSIERLPPAWRIVESMNLQELSGLCTRLLAMNIFFNPKHKVGDKWTFTENELMNLITHPNLIIRQHTDYIMMSLRWALKVQTEDRFSSEANSDVFFKKVIESLDFKTLSPEDIILLENEFFSSCGFSPTTRLALEKAKTNALQYHLHDFSKREGLDIGNVSVLLLMIPDSVAVNNQNMNTGCNVGLIARYIHEETFSYVREFQIPVSSSRAEKEMQQWSISLVKENNKKICVRATLNSDLGFERLVRMSALIYARIKGGSMRYVIDTAHIDMVTKDKTSFQIKLNEKCTSRYDFLLNHQGKNIPGIHIVMCIRNLHATTPAIK